MEPIILKGTGADIGEVHGHQYANVISRLASDNKHSLKVLAARRGATELTDAVLSQRLAELTYFIQQYTPELWDETAAMAAAAKIGESDLVALNAFLDLHDLTFPTPEASMDAPGCCTCVGLRDEELNRRLLAQNYDVRAIFQSGVLLVDLRPSEAPRALVATIAGMVGCAGMNECGVAVVINNLNPLDSQAGVPHTYIVRTILACETIDKAKEAILALPRSSGFNYLLGDGTGEIVGIETSATETAQYVPTLNGYVSHTNHYLDPGLVPLELAASANSDTLVRQARAQVSLAAISRSEVSARALQGLLSDHENYPKSICRHISSNVQKEESEWRFTEGLTVFSLVMDLVGRSMWFRKGNPCLGGYEQQTFR